MLVLLAKIMVKSYSLSSIVVFYSVKLILFAGRSAGAFDPSCCSFHDEKLSWTEAVNTCEENGQKLLCNSPKYEMKEIVDEALARFHFDYTLKFWMLSKKCDLHSKEFKPEKCLILNIPRSHPEVWMYYTYSCTQRLPFICHGPYTDETTWNVTLSEVVTTWNVTLSEVVTTWNVTLREVVTTTTIQQTTARETDSNSDEVVTRSERKTPVTSPATFVSITSEKSSLPLTFKSTTSESSTQLTSTTAESPKTSFPTTNEISTNSPNECSETTKRGITWPPTSFGKMAVEHCPGHSIGHAHWNCSESTKNWSPENPDMSQCQSIDVMNIKAKFNSTSVNETVDILNNILATEVELYGNDVVDLLEIMASLPDQLFEEIQALPEKEKCLRTRDIVTKTTSALDKILELDDSWSDIPQAERADSGSNILATADSFGLLLAEFMNSNEHTIVQKNIVIQAIRHLPGRELQLPREKETKTVRKVTKGSILLPKGFDQHLDHQKGDVSVVYVIYSDMSNVLLPPDWESDFGGKSSLNSPVVSATIAHRREPISVSSEVHILVEHASLQPNDTACVFWNLIWHKWDTTGCHLEWSNYTHSLCICNHLTNFAVLMDYKGILPDTTSLPFFFITVIGCSISIFCLSICVATFTCYSCSNRNPWGFRYSIHRNLCLTLLVANIVLIAGSDKTGNQILCAVIAGVLHYFFLSAFSWMLLEGVHIYLLLVVVFASKRSHWEKYYLFGYGFPLLVVAITALSTKNGYGTDNICWLSTKNGAIWSFTGPIACILILNCGALLLAQCKASKISTKDDNIAMIKRWLRITFILFPILGITWLFGFLYIGKHAEIPAYIFAFLNSLQGFFIFICHCVLDKKARDKILTSIKKKQASVTTESSGTQKRSKREKIINTIENALPPVDATSNAKNCLSQNFIKHKANKWKIWKHSWTFDFKVKKTEEKVLRDDLKLCSKAVVLQWNVSSEANKHL